MAYCGCGTKANKGRWCAVFVLLALAVVFLIVNIVVSRDCRVCTTESVNGTSTRVCEDPGYEADRDWDDVEGCSEGAVIATSFLFLVCLVAATVPCCCMCCCATGPRKDVDHAVAIVAKPEDPQQAGYYSHQQAPTYGEPVQAQPVVQPVYAQAQGQQVSGPPVV